MKFRWWDRLLVWIGVITLSFTALSAGGALAQDGDTDYHYFPETGHYVQGDFWAYYQRVPQAELVLGYPITEQLIRDGKRVQYFENMRLEQAPGQPVRPTPIGQELYEPLPGIRINNPSACREFASGYAVCYAFLEFFEAHGGEAVFGQPISPFEFYNGRIVQDFENARLEWRPWMSGEQKVAVAPLGLAYFERQGEDPSLRQAVVPNARVRPLSLDVRVFVWKSVTHQTDEQTLFVIVRDQAFQPLPRAQGVLQITWPDGSQQAFVFETDDRGIARQHLTFADLPAGGVVQVYVTVQSGDLDGEASTSFRIWH